MESTAATFTTGTTYDTGAADYVWTFTVVSRTAKTLTLVDEYGEVSQRRVTTGWQGHEICLPLGRYSMAPVISADQPKVAA